MQVQSDAFCQPRLYVRVVRPVGRQRAWGYLLSDEHGALLLQGQFTDRPHGGTFQPPDRLEETVLVVQARPGFWWHGRYDVMQPGSETRLGAVSRSGKIEDCHGHPVGRVRNSEPVKQKLLQSLIVGLLDSASGSEGLPATLSTPRLRVEVGGQTVAELFRVALPFELEPGAHGRAAGDAATPVGKQGSDRTRRTNGWLLDFAMNSGRVLDARLRLAAAVLNIHLLNRWGT